MLDTNNTHCSNNDVNTKPWHRDSEPIAVVGMGCRWPGGVNDTSGLWDLLIQKRTGFKKFGDHRFELDGFYHPNADRPGSIANEGGHLLAEDPRLFDHTFFGMTPLEVETMDPSQRKLLEVVFEAFENAGETWDSFWGSRTGVYVGNFTNDHSIIQFRDPDHPRPYASTGTSTSILSNRVNYILNLQGPSVTIDTACSSSMYALHLAVNALRNGDCDAAIVAGSNLIMDPAMQQMMTKLGVLSRTSTCHTFDESVDGYARGEGFAAIYLKKVSSAITDDYPIRALIRGTAINANGRTGGITHPSQQGQEAVIKKAYENAGNLNLDDTTYFECHGTGTPVGDPVEIAAISNVFSHHRTEDSPLLAGSIKTNLGHTESSSALAGIMKVILALESNLIPPSVGINKLNPKIDFQAAKIKILTEPTPWPKDQLRRASVNSFGYGGANGHCIIDHVHCVLPNYQRRPDTPLRYLNGTVLEHSNGTSTKSSWPVHYPLERQPVLQKLESGGTPPSAVLLPFSAHNETSLQLNIDKLKQTIEGKDLADIAYTLAVRRSKFSQRTFRIVDSSNPTVGLEINENTWTSNPQPPKVGFVFTGQGAQWHSMGAELFRYSVFGNAICFLDRVLRELPDPPNWCIEDILRGHSTESIDMPEISQTVCSALQIGIVDLLSSWSLKPSVVAGHSSGEIAACYAAGRIDAAEAIISAYMRGQAVSRNQADGLMLAVGLGCEDVEKYLTQCGDRVQIAAINSPGSVTLSGSAAAIKEIADTMTADQVFNRVLKTSGNAYHSYHMKPLGEWYESSLVSALENTKIASVIALGHKYASVPWISSVRPGKETTKLTVDASYWRSNLESPVDFAGAITKMTTAGTGCPDILVEIGPHPALKGPVAQILKSSGTNAPYLASLKRGQDGQTCLLQLAGSLYSANVDINLVAINSTQKIEGKDLILYHGHTAVDLPPYQYSYGPIVYHESRFSHEFRHRNSASHDLLGAKLSGNTRLRPQWRNILRLKDVPWLADHKLLPDVVFPAAGYIAMAVEASWRTYKELPNSLPLVTTSLRNIKISAALRIPDDDKGVEIIFTLDVPDGISAKSPSWMNFTVTSVSSDFSTWTEHCTGSVRVHVEDVPPPQAMSTTMDARVVSTPEWYRKFADIGLGYGPAFQGLSNIHADPDIHLATATVALDTTKDMLSEQSYYPLHPASLDALFQLALIGSHGGQMEEAYTAYVPVHIDHLYLRHGFTQDTGVGIASGERLGLRGAHARVQMIDQAGEVVLDIPRLRCISYSESVRENPASAKPFSAPLTRMVWRPDVRHLSNQQAAILMPPPTENLDKIHLFDILEWMGTLVVAEIQDMIADDCRLNDSPEHIQNFISWIHRRAADDNQWTRKAKQLTSSDRMNILHTLLKQVPDCSDVKIAWHVFQNIDDILHERKTGLDVVLENGLLSAMYEDGFIMTGAYPQLTRLFDLLGHSNPSMKILEVGAGTGGATRVIMRTLRGANQIKRYKDYTFTDVSSVFLAASRDQFFDHSDMEFGVLDIEQDPLSQGYNAVYDLVVASECLHATSDMANTLRNCRKLLKTGGKLIVVENLRTVIGHGLVLGTLPGYWSGVKDGRTESPFMDEARWKEELVKAGFSGIDILLNDYPVPYATACTIMSTAVEEESVIAPKTQVGSHISKSLLLVHGVAGEMLQRVTSELTSRGIPFTTTTLDETSPLPVDLRTIVLFDETNSLEDPTHQHWTRFQSLVQSSNTMVCLTTSGLLDGKHPNGAIITGVLRIIGTENPASRFLSIDVDPDALNQSNTHVEKSIVDLESTLHIEPTEAFEDREFTYRDGMLWVSRVVPDINLQAQAELAQMLPSSTQLLPFDSQGPVRAAFETPGILSSLYFKPYTEMWTALPDDFVQVKVAAVGLNWKDLAISAGKFDMNNFSSEFSGVVEQVGPEAAGRFSVGDRVYGMGKGHFGNYLRTPAAYIQHMRSGDDFVKVASMPLVYMTAIYAFMFATQIKPGEKVLIQTATGGLGLAALHLARSMGAEVFATAGSPSKVRYLVEQMAIPKDRIFSSRHAGDVAKIRQATDGHGFDVILGTATGDLLYESVKLLAPLGRYIDVGRVDVQNSGSIGLELFQKSATFSSFDLGLVMATSTPIASELMRNVDKLYREGKIGPIPSIMESDVSQLDQTLLSMSKGSHIGKFVVTFTNPESLVRMVPAAPHAEFLPEAEYIVTGGLGGLARSIVAWMAARGARHFTLLSRSGASSPEAKVFIHNMADKGIRIELIACDVSKLDQVSEAFKKASFTRTVKGVVHAAVTYVDLSFDKFTIEEWQAGLSAKVAGTKVLHKVTKDLPLDFFVMTTSITSVVAIATQPAYIAANNFQDAFARYRRSKGLPASTASFGLITNVGHLSTNQTTLAGMARNKVLGVTEYNFLRLFELAFLNNDICEKEPSGRLGVVSDSITTIPILTCLDPAEMARKSQQAGPEAAGVEPRWYTDGRVSLIMRAFEDAKRYQSRTSEGRDASADGDAALTQLQKQFNEAIKAGPSEQQEVESLVASAIVATVSTMLFIDASSVDPDRTVADYGVDSLIAAELRNWLKKAFRVNVSMLQLLDTSISMKKLANIVVSSSLLSTQPSADSRTLEK